MSRSLYGVFAYLGVVTLPAAFLLGFRHEPGAPIGNLYFNVIIYSIFIAVHIAMTMPALKRLLFGSPEGSPVERRIYVAISILSWLAVYVLHKPVGGFGFESPAWLQFVGLTAVLLGVVSFFEFATFESLGSMLGMPGAEVSHTAGAETPLMTEGPYASVRHPMYRAAARSRSTAAAGAPTTITAPIPRRSRGLRLRSRYRRSASRGPYSSGSSGRAIPPKTAPPGAERTAA